MYRTDLAAGLMTLGVMLIFSIVMERFFCRFICPLGLLLGWTGLFGAKLFPTLTITRACKAGGKCGRCGTACPMKIDLCLLQGGLDDRECILCLSCVKTCRNCYSVGAKK
jgi:polyferredoxin